MVYVTGDTHGDETRLHSKEMRHLKKGDTLLVCGDFGFLWDGTKAEQAMLKKLGKLRYTIAFIDGAHENFELLNNYPVTEWCGGKVHQISGNLHHLMRGQLYTIEGKSVFTMGGGMSPDEDFRVMDDNHMRWEIPSKEELDHALRVIVNARGQLDYIITHEPPMKIKAFLQLKNQTHQNMEVTGLNTFFEEMGKCCTFKRWFFGSMHVDKFIASTHGAVYRKVIPLDDK